MLLIFVICVIVVSIIIVLCSDTVIIRFVTSILCKYIMNLIYGNITSKRNSIYYSFERMIYFRYIPSDNTSYGDLIETIDKLTKSPVKYYGDIIKNSAICYYVDIQLLFEITKYPTFTLLQRRAFSSMFDRYTVYVGKIRIKMMRYRGDIVLNKIKINDNFVICPVHGNIIWYYRGNNLCTNFRYWKLVKGKIQDGWLQPPTARTEMILKKIIENMFKKYEPVFDSWVDR